MPWLLEIAKKSNANIATRGFIGVLPSELNVTEKNITRMERTQDGSKESSIPQLPSPG